MQNPAGIHPALWRGTQLAQAGRPTLSTGFPPLDAELPGHGWPMGALIELMPRQTGIGELFLLQPALAGLEPGRSVILLCPPYTPQFHCWVNWRLENRRLLWLAPKTPSDTLWAAETILRHNACGALLCWAAAPRAAALRRLHLAAQQSDTLFVLMRPPAALQQASAAVLRMLLQPLPQGLEVHIHKRRGPLASRPIPLSLYGPRLPAPPLPSDHVPLDQPLPAFLSARRHFA
ncbi:translesion DNA synthesis-associated protein ImuA [Parapusillimonas granuli]|uniref:Translesion DNA synthesis-associated protein ImuA n=1 Tax=Parapusillimonas granuli TaxID=380911 RepID=A0A853G8U9_9BURK|nr:translesion DNA synthesis-associated protein ImuA [Parapusillimonas granuli]